MGRPASYPDDSRFVGVVTFVQPIADSGTTYWFQPDYVPMESETQRGERYGSEMIVFAHRRGEQVAVELLKRVMLEIKEERLEHRPDWRAFRDFLWKNRLGARIITEALGA